MIIVERTPHPNFSSLWLSKFGLSHKGRAALGHVQEQHHGVNVMVVGNSAATVSGRIGMRIYSPASHSGT